MSRTPKHAHTKSAPKRPRSQDAGEDDARDAGAHGGDDDDDHEMNSGLAADSEEGAPPKKRGKKGKKFVEDKVREILRTDGGLCR